MSGYVWDRVGQLHSSWQCLLETGGCVTQDTDTGNVCCTGGQLSLATLFNIGHEWLKTLDEKDAKK